MPVKESPAPEASAGPDVESALARDLYLLAPLKLPRGQQYAVGASDGQTSPPREANRRAAAVLSRSGPAPPRR